GYKPGPRWEAVNVLAEKLEVSSDGRRFAFTLKKGVQFHHGFGEVTADDVKYSYERIAGIQKLYPNAGAKDVSLYASNWQELERVKVTGRYTGIIVLKKPDATVLTTNLPFYSTGLVVSKKAIQQYGKHGAATNPVGTGPYQLPHSYTPG